MSTRFTLMRMSVGLALGGALVLLLLWAFHPAATSPETSRSSTKPVPPRHETLPPEAAPKEARVPSTPATASPAAQAASPVGPTSAAPSQPKPGPRGGRWDHLQYLRGISAGQGEEGCQEAIRRTAVHLSIDPTRAPDFQVAARESVLEMEQALDLRKRELSTSPPSTGSSVVSDQERQSAERYAAARAKALDRLEKFLGQTTAHQDFRWSFDSWASMVASKTRETR